MDTFDSICDNNKNNNTINGVCGNTNNVDDSAGKSVVQQQPLIYSIKLDEANNKQRKSYVLIETTNNEEHTLTVNLLKSRFPSASIFSSTESAAPYDDCQHEDDLFEYNDVSSDNHYLRADNISKSKNDFVNKILKVYQKRNNDAAAAALASKTSKIQEEKTNHLSPNDALLSSNSTSMERQESRDSGFWSISKCSFESMKSLSINDNTPITASETKPQVTHQESLEPQLQQQFQSSLNVSPSSNKLKMNNWKKWKKEHTLRYSNSETQSGCGTNDSFDTQNDVNTSFDTSTTSSTSNIGLKCLPIKSKSLDCSTNSTDDMDPYSDKHLKCNDFIAKQLSSESIIESNSSINSAGTSSTTMSGHKRRGRLVRDMTIDDENLIVPSFTNESTMSTDIIEDSNNQEESSGISITVPDVLNKNGRKATINCSSPIEKRSSLFFYKRQMSIDDAEQDKEVTKAKHKSECKSHMNNAAYICNCGDCVQKYLSENYFKPNSHQNDSTPTATTTTANNENKTLATQANLLKPQVTHNGNRAPNLFTQSVSFDSYNNYNPYSYLYDKTKLPNNQNPFLVRSYTTYDDNYCGSSSSHDLDTKYTNSHLTVPLTATANLSTPVATDSVFNTANSNNKSNLTKTDSTNPATNTAIQMDFLNTIFNPYFHSFSQTNNKNRLMANTTTYSTPFQNYFNSNDFLNIAKRNESVSAVAAMSDVRHNENLLNKNGYGIQNLLATSTSPSTSTSSIHDSLDKRFQFSLDLFTAKTNGISSKLNKRQNTATKVLDTNKPHVCLCCQKKFARSDMLIRHSRLHSGLRPYKCNQCGQEFSRSDHLNTHQRTHTGEKPYACPYPKCSYAACRKDMITRHLKVHNKNRSPTHTTNSHGNYLDTNAHLNTPSSSPSSLSLSVSSPPSYTSHSLASPSACTESTIMDNENDFIESKPPPPPPMPTQPKLPNLHNLTIPTIRIDES